MHCFVDDKIAAEYFKDEIKPYLESNNRLKFTQDVTMNNAREKEKNNANSHIK